jgi:hypothetical protein
MNIVWCLAKLLWDVVRGKIYTINTSLCISQKVKRSNHFLVASRVHMHMAKLVRAQRAALALFLLQLAPSTP